MADLILPDDGRDDVQPGYGPQAELDEPGLLRRAWIAVGLSSGRESRRLAAVVAVAVLCGAAAVVAIGDADDLDDPTALGNRIEAEAVGPTAADDGALAPGDDDSGPSGDTTSSSDSAPRAGSAIDPSTTPANSTGTTADGATTTGSLEVSVSSTAGQAPADDTTSSTVDDPTSTTSTATTGSTTSTTTGSSPSTTARGSSTTAEGTTTQPPTTTTQAPTTTTRPPTTQPPTTVGNSCASGAEFELVMRDDFNESSIGSQWHVWPAGDNSGYGPRRLENISVGDGRLLLEAYMDGGTLYTAGMNHHHAQTYGKYRFRARTDVDPNRALSGVILTWPAAGDHLRNGENNIYETLAHQDSPTRSPFYSFIHKPFAANASQQEYKIWRADAAQWQTMTMEWTPDRITITRDGGETWTVDETGADLIPDVPHRFHIQLDAWQHSISGYVTMEVDFAEVYRYCG